MKETQAEILLALIEAATDCNWPNTKSALDERGFKPQEIVDAWKALEDMTSISGTVPDVEDF